MSRYFRFRLRTLFLIMTLFAIGLGYFNAQAKRYAAARRQWVSSHSHRWILTESERVLLYGDRSRAPGPVRIWLGDECYDWIVLDQAASAATEQEAVDLLPEADIYAPRASVHRHPTTPAPLRVVPARASAAF
jgi:hypothetical protein